MNKAKFIKCSNGHTLGEIRPNGVFISKHRGREIIVKASGTVHLKCGQCGEKHTLILSFKSQNGGDGK